MGIVSYEIKDKDGQPVFVMVDVNDAGQGLPRKASTTEIKKCAEQFETVLAPLSALSRAVIHALKSASPSELGVEFGVELGGTAGIPLITKSEGKANFKVQLKWKPGSTRQGDGDE